MKILILGGTKFLGRHLLAAAQAGGHEVTLFNRGRHTSEKFENVEQIHGDRNSDLDKLSERRWDACIDTSGYLPQTVKRSVEFLSRSVNQYVFISSVSAYSDFSHPNINEFAPLAQFTKEQQNRAAAINVKGDMTGFVLGDLYGGLKVLCEQAVEGAMPHRNLIIRPGLIVGSYDSTDRFTYWVARIAQGGEVLAPGSPQRFVQLIDVRDLAEWTVRMIGQGETGIYNATGEPFLLTMEKMLGEIKSSTRSDARFVWVSEEFLRQENIQPWSEMPLYLPESDTEMSGFLSINIDRALGKGLTFRSLTSTVQDIYLWRESKSEELKAGISKEREKELLHKWLEQ